ncbi:MAG: putative toxin-antitoxin system toxin component, PIN family [candidate division NC10 bacterium]|nr:putative toxin-antitoxin system toxin component, PIN family [candidate division NC10 bacterium]
MRAVFDTNVYVAAFLAPGGEAEQALLDAYRRQVELYTSLPILTEVARVLRGKFGVGERTVTSVLRTIARAAILVRPRRRVATLADEPDNRILECAAEAGADLIVTGDRNLLRLREFEGVAIVRLTDFLRMFPVEPAP